MSMVLYLYRRNICGRQWQRWPPNSASTISYMYRLILFISQIWVCSGRHGSHISVLCEYVCSTFINVYYSYLRSVTGSSSDGPHIAVLCEYDSLPGIGHACGHNLIAEVGLAAGIGIRAAMNNSDKPIGKVNSKELTP